MQDQIVGQLDAHLQHTYQQLHGLQQQATAGLGSMLASSPQDYTAFRNALAAIAHQARDLSRSVEQLWGEQLCDRLFELEEQGIDTQAACHHCERLVREGTQWIDDQWAQFEAQWNMHALHAMWPLVEQGLAQPPSCTHCGGPLHPQQRRSSESVTCRSCGSVNQTTPEPVVGMYYAIAPDIYATHASLERRAQITAHRLAWENQRVAIKQQTGDWPDEPIDSLRRWEELERAYWTTYAEAKAQLEPHDVGGFIESRMKFFYDDMARNDVWRQANGMGPSQGQLASQVNQLPDDVMEWSPLRYDQVEENFFHQTLLSMLESEPAAYQQLLHQLGYRDATHRALVDRTFQRYYRDQSSEPWFQQALNAAAMRAMQERGNVMASNNQHLLAPIEGVTLEVFAELSAKRATASPEEMMTLLAQHQLDRETFDRVNAAWLERMSQDATGTISIAYSKAFMGGGQYGAAGQAAADNLGAGGMATGSGAGGGEPIPFETYAEISGAMTAWSQQGKDISAMLEQHFQMSAIDFSNISMWWSTKMTTDMSLMDRMGELTDHYEQVWLGQP